MNLDEFVELFGGRRPTPVVFRLPLVFRIFLLSFLKDEIKFFQKCKLIFENSCVKSFNDYTHSYTVKSV